MAAPTEKDLEQMQARNQKLREQIAEAESQAAVNVQEKSREIDAALLKAETARLEAQLRTARDQAKASYAKDGAAAPLAAANEQLALAESGQTVPGVPVDTNAETSADEKKE